MVEHVAQYRALDADGRFEPVMVCYSPEVERQVSELVDIRLHVLAQVMNQDRNAIPFLTGIWSRLRCFVPFASGIERFCGNERISHSFPVAVVRYLAARRSLRRAKRIMQECIVELKPSLMLIPGDRELGMVPAMTSVARAHGIPTVISLTTAIPIRTASKVDERSAHHRFRTKLADMPPLWNAWLGWRHPGLVSKDPRKVLFSPGWLVSALMHEGMLGRNPWYQGGGHSDYLLAEGPRKIAVYREGGVPEGKLLAVGSLLLDDVYEAYRERQKLRRALASDKQDERIVVFAVPSYPEQGLLEWTEHIDALRKTAMAIARQGLQPILSLHPKSDPESYRFMQDEFGCRLEPNRTSRELVAAADLLVCGNSTLIEVAALCSVPVINLDYANMRMANWDDYAGVVTISDPAEFEQCLKRCFGSRKIYAKMCDAQRHKGQELAFFDGRSRERFCDAMAGLASARQQSSCATSV